MTTRTFGIQTVHGQDFYHWRLIGTGLSFALFGLGGLLFGLLVVPILHLFPADAATRRTRARRLIGASMRLFIDFMRTVGVLTYEFHGAERLGRPRQLIVANHPSLIDVVFLLAFARDAGCVVKHGLWRNPLTRGAVRSAGYCSNVSTDTMIAAAVGVLGEGQSLIMFPEGTRTRPGVPMALHRGAANVAVKAAQVVTPVYIRVAPTTLTKAEPWYRIPRRRPRFSMRVGEDLAMDEFRGTGPVPVASRIFHERLRETFEKEFARHDA